MTKERFLPAKITFQKDEKYFQFTYHEINTSEKVLLKVGVYFFGILKKNEDSLNLSFSEIQYIHGQAKSNQEINIEFDFLLNAYKDHYDFFYFCPSFDNNERIEIGNAVKHSRFYKKEDFA